MEESSVVVEGPLDHAADRARAALGGHLAVVSLFTDRWQVFVGASGLGDPYQRTRRVSLVESFCQHAREVGAQLVVPDVSAYPSLSRHPIGRELGFVSYLTWPVSRTDGTDMGVVSVFDRVVRDWSTIEVTMLETIARECAPDLQELIDSGQFQRMTSEEDGWESSR